MGGKLFRQQLNCYVAVASCYVIMGNTYDKGDQNEVDDLTLYQTQKLTQNVTKIIQNQSFTIKYKT